MKEFKTSYILSKSEILILLSFNSNIQPTAPAKYILSEYLANIFETGEAVEGLVFKKLARKEGGKLVVEPVIDFISKSVLLADRLWLVTWINPELHSLIIQSRDLWLLITNYPLMDEAWKVTPFQSIERMTEEMWDCNLIKDVISISKDGKKYLVKHDNNFLWLEEDENG